TQLALGHVSSNLSPQIKSLGFVSDDDEKAWVYSAADFLIHPAREDNQPLTVLEALACGTPVLAFDVGGLGEIIREGQNGWLAPAVNPKSLAEGIRRAVRAVREGTSLRDRCR